MTNRELFARLKELYGEVKNQTDLTRKAVPFFEKTIVDIRAELMKIAAHQGEQVSQNVEDAMKAIFIAEREDLKNIYNYQNFNNDMPKYLARLKNTILTQLAFVTKF